MNKINMDDLFCDIYGFKPKKRGKGYELLVGAVLKILNNNAEVQHDVFIESNYSKDYYQADNLVTIDNESIFVEAKDYSERNKKVGRPDISKLSGALLHIPTTKGYVFSSTDFTKPAINHAADCLNNPKAKPIDLFIVRQMFEKDIEGRINTIVLNMNFLIPDYSKAKWIPCWTESSKIIFEELGYIKGEGSEVLLKIDNFYDSTGKVIDTIWNLTSKIVCDTSLMQAKGKFSFNEKGHICVEGKYVPIKYLEYEIPYRTITRKKEITSGKPCILVRSQDGSIDKLITYEDLREIKFENL